MADNNGEPFATAGSGKSDAEVAFELVSKLKGQGVWGEKNMPQILDMYAECLDAVKGLRAYEGQRRVYSPIHMNSGSKIPSIAQAPSSPAVTQPETQMAQKTQIPGAQAQQTEAARPTPPAYEPKQAPRNPVQDQLAHVKQVMKF